MEELVAKYMVGEKVFCNWKQNIWYEAKILKIKKYKDPHSEKIHIGLKLIIISIL